MISDQCGNETTVEQTLVFSDDQAPFWLNEPNEVIITDDIDGGTFDLPVANDICSSLDVTMSTTSGQVIAPFHGVDPNVCGRCLWKLVLAVCPNHQGGRRFGVNQCSGDRCNMPRRHERISDSDVSRRCGAVR